MKTRLDELLAEIAKEDFNESPPNDLRNAVVVLIRELRKEVVNRSAQPNEKFET